MKKCHFCYEDIQDSAIRCKHCGADIAAAEAAAKEAKFEQSYSNGFGKFWAVIGAAIFGLLAFGAYTERLYMDIAICVAFGLVFLFLAPKAWQVGFLARNAGQPDIIIASSAGELAKQRFYYEYGARIFLTGGLFVVLLAVLYFVVPLDRIVFGPGTQVAASSEAKPLSASGAADAQAAASSASSDEVPKAVADGQSAGSDAATSAAPVQASSDNATQTAQQQTDQEKAVNVSLALSASTASAEQQSASTTTLKPDANGTTSIHASFDCAKASSPIERLICSSPETANADLRLADSFSKARAKSSDPAALKADQRKWMKVERDACSDATCLLAVTEARIHALAAM
ncbi:lysozyme inhibitor LprI family protein [Burkholderia pseudomallei]|uniref:lysozyme inhibitor LprI family protein n=1 Tax=Burkholderia pseudomallei TaxID=28450 RepID=UPI0021F782A2|nr:lysozyme inhibitor LprI family protein [Burkholderia pseudomallei]MCV9980955.1 lysozyme inhibitor LprI family protein [Burkholderia pseudomallei]MCV9987149.1 lysozyme inhibitor LprI family protein [Burkholderia pseudomallei]MCW0030170.1 lysozyme inhibitor LprI family protein [Burkholderia pseudomallei]MCW0091334.1 lysozyme inhibitor LprI family protein [Burkholderia pseudomallei]MCW0105879.1 lysozyme inhibitor LprI family protein [Burkholderia pseudomallei]